MDRLPWDSGQRRMRGGDVEEKVGEVRKQGDGEGEAELESDWEVERKPVGE